MFQEEVLRIKKNFFAQNDDVSIILKRRVILVSYQGLSLSLSLLKEEEEVS